MNYTGNIHDQYGGRIHNECLPSEKRIEQTSICNLHI